MTSFIEVACRCGRLVRATPDQGGTTVRCWNCGSDIQIPAQGSAGKVLAEFAAATRRTLNGQTVGTYIGVALGTTAILMIPYVGNLLAFGVLVVGARLYQNMIREGTPPPRAGGPEDATEGEAPDWLEWVISVLAAAALMAPFWARSWSQGLIVPAARWALIVTAFASWPVVPAILFALNARDRFGVVPPRLALTALARHPVAAVAALLILPLGFCSLEAATVAIVKSEESLTQLVDDMFAAPRLAHIRDRVGSIYRFDDLTVSVMLGTESENALRLYRSALGRGYTLVGTVPRSLSRELDPNPTSMIVLSIDVSSLALRAALTIMILTGACIFLSIQARWLGLIALLGTPRHADAAAPQPEPRPSPAPFAPTQSVPAPIRPAAPVPAPAPPPAPVPVPARPDFQALSGAPAMPARASAVRTILIVDGDRGFAVDVSRILSARGFGVILAGSATEATATALGARPDLIVLDTMLPDRSGIQFCHELRAAMPGPERPVLIATSATATAAEISAMASAADDYMVKPYVIEALIRRIDQHLKSRP